MTLTTWKQLGEAADIEMYKQESVTRMDRLCRKLRPRFEWTDEREENSPAENRCLLCGRSEDETEYMVPGLSVGEKTGGICKDCVGVYHAYLARKLKTA